MLLQVEDLPEWKKILRKNFFDMSRLAEFLELTDEQMKKILFRSKFSLNLPIRLAEKIEKGRLDDPILRQFIPLDDEEVRSNDYFMDPVGDECSKVSEKLLQKYDSRMLLVSTSACAMHCRYCFRRHFDYETTEKSFLKEIALLENDSTISEVILSGGDPLSLDDKTLKGLLDRIASISHVKKIRFHTRFPIGIPERITDSFLHLLQSIPVQCWFVVHINHPKELDADVLLALKKIQKLGVPVLNQSVLLKGVNDDVETLAQLLNVLVDNGIIPYYLHQLDRVQGAAHFEVEEEKGTELIRQLTDRLPGYGVPRYVKEIAGRKSKSPVLHPPVLHSVDYL